MLYFHMAQAAKVAANSCLSSSVNPYLGTAAGLYLHGFVVNVRPDAGGGWATGDYDLVQGVFQGMQGRGNLSSHVAGTVPIIPHLKHNKHGKN